MFLGVPCSSSPVAKAKNPSVFSEYLHPVSLLSPSMDLELINSAKLTIQQALGCSVSPFPGQGFQGGIRQPALLVGF